MVLKWPQGVFLYTKMNKENWRLVFVLKRIRKRAHANTKNKEEKRRKKSASLEEHTHNNEPSAGPREGHVDLVLVGDETHVLVTPSQRGVWLYLVGWQRANCAHDHVVPLSSLISKETNPAGKEN